MISRNSERKVGDTDEQKRSAAFLLQAEGELTNYNVFAYFPSSHPTTFCEKVAPPTVIQ